MQRPTFKFLPVVVVAVLIAASGAQASRDEHASTSTAVPQVAAASNQDNQWRPTADQQERVVNTVLAYFAAKDTGRFADAYALFTPIQKSVVPFEKWEADMREVYLKAGASGGRTLKKVTWYKNPANAPAGIYAAVDFSSQFAELSLHCGFVALQQQMDGSFGIAREEENSISKRDMAKLSPETLQRIRATYRC